MLILAPEMRLLNVSLETQTFSSLDLHSDPETRAQVPHISRSYHHTLHRQLVCILLELYNFHSEIGWSRCVLEIQTFPQNLVQQLVGGIEIQN